MVFGLFVCLFEINFVCVLQDTEDYVLIISYVTHVCVYMYIYVIIH